MLAKPPVPHIDLREKNHHETMAIAGPAMDKKPEPRGPMVHIHGIDLPLSDAHVNKTGEASIKYKLRKKSTGEAYGTPSNKASYDIEIISIKFGDKGA